MLSKEILLLTADGDTEGGAAEYEACGNRILRFEAGSECKIRRATVRGTAFEDDRGYMGAGYPDGSGSFKLDIRIHGERFLDGTELVRLMQVEGSDAYGGEYDEEHFLYNSGAQSCTVISSDHLMLPSSPCTLGMTARTDKASQGGTLPGLQYESIAGTRVALSSSETGPGDVYMKAITPVNHIFRGFIHKNNGSDALIPIRYDSVSLSEGNTATDEPYHGQAYSFNLGSHPLLADYDNQIADELDLLTGTITRRFGGCRINAQTDITDVLYMGFPCFRIRLPERAREGLLKIGQYSSDSLEGMLEFGECGMLSPAGDCVYFRLYEDSTLDDVKAELDGVLMIYTLLKERTVSLGQAIDPSIPAGVSYIEVCTQTDAEINIIYKEKE